MRKPSDEFHVVLTAEQVKLLYELLQTLSPDIVGLDELKKQVANAW